MRGRILPHVRPESLLRHFVRPLWVALATNRPSTIAAVPRHRGIPAAVAAGSGAHFQGPSSPAGAGWPRRFSRLTRQAVQLLLGTGPGLSVNLKTKDAQDK